MTTRTRAPKHLGMGADLETVGAEREPSTFDVFIEHQRKAMAEAAKALMALLPDGVQTHGETAIKESIEGYRDLVNSTLDDVIEFIQKAKLERPETKEKL